MDRTQIFLFLALLLATNGYPQDGFPVEVESTTVASFVEGLTTPSPVDDVTGTEDIFMGTTEKIIVESRPQDVGDHTVSSVSKVENEQVSVNDSTTSALNASLVENEVNSTVIISKPMPTPAPKMEKIVRSLDQFEAVKVNPSTESPSNTSVSSSSVESTSSTTTTPRAPIPDISESESLNVISKLPHAVPTESSPAASESESLNVISKLPHAVPTESSPAASESESLNVISKLPHAVSTESSPAAPVIESTTQQPYMRKCMQAGNYSHPTDCHRYITCNITYGHQFSREEHRCPEHMAFSETLARCSTDIAHCHEGPECIGNKTEIFLDDPNSNSSFYWCGKEWSDSPNFHKFYIKCSEGQVYDRQLKNCCPSISPANVTFIDILDLARWELSKIREVVYLLGLEEKNRKRSDRKARHRAQKLATRKGKKQKKVSKVNDCDSSDEDDA